MHSAKSACADGAMLGARRFQLLDGHVCPDDPHSVTAVLLKNALDQMLLAPFGLAMFFVVLKCLEGQPQEIASTLRNKWVTSGCLPAYMHAGMDEPAQFLFETVLQIRHPTHTCAC